MQPLLKQTAFSLRNSGRTAICNFDVFFSLRVSVFFLFFCFGWCAKINVVLVSSLHIVYGMCIACSHGCVLTELFWKRVSLDCRCFMQHVHCHHYSRVGSSITRSASNMQSSCSQGGATLNTRSGMN